MIYSKQDAGGLLQYVKHLVFSMAIKGWNVVVSNHRGLGGISITVSSTIDQNL
jgi:predicted alpha/beta-fold hydrolase